MKTKVNGICVKPVGAADAAPALAAAPAELLELPLPLAVIEVNSTFFWLEACASW